MTAREPASSTARQTFSSSRRGFCLCCLSASVLTTASGWLSPRGAFAQARGIVDSMVSDAARSPIKVYRLRGSVAVLQRRLPYVTLLLRARGNTAVERAAVNRRRQFDRYVAGLVKQAEADGDIRPDIDPGVTARLLFGMVNSLIEWYRPAHSDLADAVCAIAFDGLRQRKDVG